MKDALIRAQFLYKRDKFRHALEVLESHVQAGALSQLTPSEQMIALDLLASLCEKQGSLNKARNYAGRMIRIKDRDPRGYLRLGKILQLIPGKLKEAVQIYKRASVKVDPLDPACRRFLSKQIELCIAKQQQGDTKDMSEVRRKCDPVAKLPHELLVLIFDRLSLRQRVICTLVSRLWLQFLTCEPTLWMNLEFDAVSTDALKVSIVSADTVRKYCYRAGSSSRLELNLQRVLVRDPKAVFAHLASSQECLSKLSLLRFDISTPVNEMPIIRMMRHSLPALTEPITNGHMLPMLRELQICADMPERDIKWCLHNLPNLEVLNVATTQRTRAERHQVDATLSVASSQLHTISLLGRSGTRVLSDHFASQLVSLPSLEHIDLHRVVPNFWPTMHGAVTNAKLKRFGFTSEGIHAKDRLLPLPKFAGELTSLTLNDIALSCISIPPILPDGSRYAGGSRAALQRLGYIELKRVIITEFNLAELINTWGCAATLKTLVVHSFSTQSHSQYPSEGHLNFEILQQLETLQFTGMGNLTDDFYEWLISACPNLRKVNFDGTLITGPKLVKLLHSKPKLQFVRCKNAVDLSADTVAWIRGLKHVTVTF